MSSSILRAVARPGSREHAAMIAMTTARANGLQGRVNISLIIIGPRVRSRAISASRLTPLWTPRRLQRMGVTMVSGGASPAEPKVPSLQKLLEPIAAELHRVEAALGEQVQGFDAGVGDYVQYVLGGVGKRLRPTLALLTGGATGGIDEGHIALGVIVELIHVATLVHDDVLDEALLRHGLPTSNSRWGNEISVLLGDCLFAHALRLAASYPTTAVRSEEHTSELQP